MPKLSEIKTLIAFDFGLKRIGVAVGQTITRSASPVGILKAQEGIPDWDEIAALISTWHADAIVVGIPLALDGSDLSVTPNAKKFANRLQARYGLPVFCIDEQLSSVEARAILEKHGAKMSSSKKIDDVVATLLLQSWFDTNRNS